MVLEKELGLFPGLEKSGEVISSLHGVLRVIITNYNDAIMINSVTGVSHGEENILLYSKLGIDHIGSQCGTGIILAMGKLWNWRISCTEGTQNLTFNGCLRHF